MAMHGAGDVGARWQGALRGATRSSAPGWRGLVVVLGVSCSIACRKPEPPTLTPRVAQVAAVSASGLDLDVQVQVDNPNAFAIAAQAVSGTLYVGDGQKLGSGQATPEQSIPADGTSLVQSRVHIDFRDLAALAPLLASESIPYMFKGDVTLGGEKLNVTLPFTLNGTLTRSQLLSAGWRGLGLP